jgi:hypothetical protein
MAACGWPTVPVAGVTDIRSPTSLSNIHRVCPTL